jgi:hypothetical protein
MLKKVLIVCVALTLAIVLLGVAGSVSTQTLSNPSTASAATVKSTTTTTTTAHPIFLSYEQPANFQFQSYTGPFVGSINSNVYHYPWCPDAKKILPKNLVTFATVADACAAGYRPCKVCDPPSCSPTATATPTPAPSASTVATPTPTVMPTSTIAPTSTPAAASPSATLKPAAASPSATLKPAAASTSTANVAQASVAASSSTSTPGFEGLYALGALAAVFLALRITRRS